MTPTEIKNAVSEYSGVSIEDMEGKSRKRKIINARFPAIHFIKKLVKPELSLKEIGKEFGGRDHSSVIHALTVVQNLTESDRHFRNHIEGLRSLIIKIQRENSVGYKGRKESLKFALRILLRMDRTFEVNQKIHELQLKLKQL